MDLRHVDRRLGKLHFQILQCFYDDLGDSEIPPVFDSDYVPATYVVSPDGFVVYQHTGAALWDDPRVVSFLRGLSVQHRLSQAQNLPIPA